MKKLTDLQFMAIYKQAKELLQAVDAKLIAAEKAHLEATAVKKAA